MIMHFEQFDETARAEKLSNFLVSKGFNVTAEECTPYYKFREYRSFDHRGGGCVQKIRFNTR